MQMFAAVDAASPRGRKETQRERLLAGIVAAAAQHGYAGASVSCVILHAGVSRPTFYDYFTDKDDCFLAALAEIHGRLVARITKATAAGKSEQALVRVIQELVVFAREDPVTARFLMSEALSAGERSLAMRLEGISLLGEIVEAAYSKMAPTARAPDLAPATAIGATYRLLSARLQRGERALAGVLTDLLAWIASYESRASRHRWRAHTTHPPLHSTALLQPSPAHPPPALPPGRPRLSEEEIAENHRLRILLATATLVAERGYHATTVTEIAKVSQLDGRAFYKSFEEKQAAFTAMYEWGIHELLAVTADAFFAAASWPQRVWAAGRALVEHLERNPTLTRSGFVEVYAAGADAAQRVEAGHGAFTVFLREGYQLRTGAGSPTQVALEAVIAAIFELVHRQACNREELLISGLLPSIAHLCLTPFMGAEEANAFIDRQLQTSPAQAHRAGRLRSAAEER